MTCHIEGIGPLHDRDAITRRADRLEGEVHRMEAQPERVGHFGCFILSADSVPHGHKGLQHIVQRAGPQRDNAWRRRERRGEGAHIGLAHGAHIAERLGNDHVRRQGTNARSIECEQRLSLARGASHRGIYLERRRVGVDGTRRDARESARTLGEIARMRDSHQPMHGA